MRQKKRILPAEETAAMLKNCSCGALGGGYTYQA